VYLIWYIVADKRQPVAAHTARKVDPGGSTVESFLEEQGILADAEAVALKRVIAWQIEQAMAAKGITKNAMAKRLSTSRTQVDRLLDPAHVGISLDTIARAAKAVGKRVAFQVIDCKTKSASAPRAARAETVTAAKAPRKGIAQAG